MKRRPSLDVLGFSPDLKLMIHFHTRKLYSVSVFLLNSLNLFVSKAVLPLIFILFFLFLIVLFGGVNLLTLYIYIYIYIYWMYPSASGG